MSRLVLTLSGTATASDIRSALAFGKKQRLSAFLSDAGDAMGGSRQCSVQLLNADDVAASATVTMSFTHQTADDTIQIGAMTLTAKSSGATGAQFNIGASNTISATNLAAAINANSSGLLNAKSAAAIVTISAAFTGTLGNAIPIILTQSDSAGMTASGTSLSGGLADTAATKSFSNFS